MIFEQLVGTGLIKKYKQRQVISGIDLQISRSSIVGLLGANGAGKTTTFNIFSGLISPDKGRVLLGDRDLSKLNLAARSKLGIGYLPQKSSIFAGMSVIDNIYCALELQSNLSKSAKKSTLMSLLKKFNLDHIATSKGGVLSGGERRRTEIARALATAPDFILLDEPFAGVDPIAIGDIKNIIFDLKQSGLGVFITDHNAYEILDVCDYIYVLSGGKLIFSGLPAAAVTDPLVQKCYLGSGFTIKA